jgi:hypothetical protein
VFTAKRIEGCTTASGFLAVINRWWKSVIDVLWFDWKLAALFSTFIYWYCMFVIVQGITVHNNER